MAFDCDVIFGSSGAPVLAPHGGRPRILSLVSGGSREGGERLAYGMDLRDLVVRLKRDLRAATAGQITANPGFKRVRAGEERRGTGAKFARP